MKALFVGPHLGAGGAERQWSLLLPGLRGRGIDARLIALDAGGPFEQPLRMAGVPVEVIAMRHQADLTRLVQSALFRDFQPDVVVSRGVSGLYVGQAVSWWRRALHVYADHQQIDMPIARRRELLLRGLARHLSVVVTVNGNQTPRWIARGLEASKLVVIENGVAVPTPASSRSTVRSRLDLAESSVVVFYAAALRPEKRVSDFINSVRSAHAQGAAIVAVIAGDGDDRNAVQLAANEDAFIQWLGHRDDIPDLMNAVDIFALTSQYEAVPMAILEAMASGLPVVATRVGAIPDVLVDGVTGVLVPPGDIGAMTRAIMRLSRNAEVRADLGRAARRTFHERFTAARMIEAYVSLLTVLQQRRLAKAAPALISARPDR